MFQSVVMIRFHGKLCHFSIFVDIHFVIDLCMTEHGVRRSLTNLAKFNPRSESLIRLHRNGESREVSQVSAFQ
jgi:hypothetical protein